MEALEERVVKKSMTKFDEILEKYKKLEQKVDGTMDTFKDMFTKWKRHLSDVENLNKNLIATKVRDGTRVDQLVSPFDVHKVTFPLK